MSRLTAEQLEEWLRERMPVKSEQHSLELVRVSESPEGDLTVTLQVLEWDVWEDGIKRIRDIREQDVRALPQAYRDEPERVKAAVAGWAAALEQVLGHLEPGGYFMPSELWSLPLWLRRAHTAEAFQTACLARSRLGRWVPSK